MSELQTLVSRKMSVEQCRINYDVLFIFGDNLEREGMGGQAIIREQINSVGIVTKKKSSMTDDSFFKDEEFEQNCKYIDEDIEKIKKYAIEKNMKAYGFSFFGIGTGLSSMQTKCPKTFCYLSIQLIDNFKFNNLQSLKSK